MTGPEILAKCDVALVTALEQIATYQAVFSSTKGGYWQGLKTGTAPKDGADEMPSVTAVPTDQVEPWPIDILASPMPMGLTVDVYDGPDGKGYVVRSEVQIGADVYTMASNVGPEKHREQAWAKVVPMVFS